jgi:hypothetical protein
MSKYFINNVDRALQQGKAVDELIHQTPRRPDYEPLPTKTSFRLLNLSLNLARLAPRAPIPSSTTQISPRRRRKLLTRSTPVSIDNIYISMDTYDLETAPPFKALSYTWGPPYREVYEEDPELAPQFTAQIKCDGKTIAVMQNLYDALAAIIETGFNGLLWVDALCIDQEDLEERGSQICLMGRIYSSATQVIAWIGPQPEQGGFEELMWASTELVSVLHSVEDDETIMKLSTGGIHKPELLETLSLDNPLPRLVTAAYFYRCCRWFSRAWVVQEVLLAADVDIMCGKSTISMHQLMHLASCLHRIDWDNEISRHISRQDHEPTFSWLQELRFWYDIKDRISGHLDMFSQVRDRWKEDGRQVWWLFWVLDLLQNTECQDPRDRIYSVLGIVEELRRPGDQLVKDLIVPNYRMPSEELFTRVTKLILNNTDSFDCLQGRTQYSFNTSNLHSRLPSWAIDFSTTRKRNLARNNPEFNSASTLASLFPK